MKKQLDKNGLNYLVRVAIQVIAGAILFFVSAATLHNLRGWIYFLAYSLSASFGIYYLSINNPEVLNERAKSRDNTESWDKVLLKLYILLAFFIIYIIAGLDVRFGWSDMSIGFMFPALIFIILSSFLGIWAMKENANFEATSRIQNDRIQNICDTGPYGIVRHPGYLSIIIWAVAIPFVFGSFYMMIPSSCISIIIIIRTYLEDNMLKEKLSGYVDYAKRTKYRLLPFIW